jgi:hypothetical protein
MSSSSVGWNRNPGGSGAGFGMIFSLLNLMIVFYFILYFIYVCLVTSLGGFAS